MWVLYVNNGDCCIVPSRRSGVRIVAQIRLFLPLASLTGLFPIASNLPPPALFTGTDGRGSLVSILALVAQTPAVWFPIVAVAVVGTGRRVLEAFKCMKHEDEAVDEVLVLDMVENSHGIREIRTETVVDQKRSKTDR